MFPPYIVEEYDGKFWVHKHRKYNCVTGETVRGELAYEEPFDTHKEAQEKAFQMETATGLLW